MTRFELERARERVEGFMDGLGKVLFWCIFALGLMDVLRGALHGWIWIAGKFGR